MNQQIENIDYKWLTESTGDSFADAGGYALKEFAKRYPEKNILELIEEVTKIYVYRWEAKINPFFLNSKVTQPAFKAERKIDETMKYFRELIEGKTSIGTGYCRISGRKAQLFVAGRDNSILSGSGTFVNFHHTFEAGIMVSKEMLVRFHFVPLACILLQGRIALIHSNDNHLTEFFAAENCSKNLQDVAMNVSDGILKSTCKVPATALFRFIDEAVEASRDENEIKNFSLTLYHFTNFGASPEVQIYTLPSEVFAFYFFTRNEKVKEVWERFVGSYYRSSEFKGIKYNEMTRQFDFSRKNEVENIGQEVYQNWSNVVYNRLLEGRSILPLMRAWCEEHVFNLKIVDLYLTKVRHMKQEAQKKILELAELMVEFEGEHKIGKCIQEIKNAKSSSGLTRLLISKVLAKNLEMRNSTVLTVQECCEYLFPEGVFWRDVRDLFLIGIYQTLHEKGIYLNAEETVVEDESLN
ncbi:MAG: type I-B CRISPR-associated protein Cas8b1/Cst1 [Odoribacter sp.]|nr:type I-B CRISPR-associated protein Cas8b1/Cst1 [Odoribacter sp.]